jgi:uncharacterized protein YbjQ (UPF0145 family)
MRFPPDNEATPEVDSMLIVTTDTIPGHRVASVIGEVIGVTARSNNPFTEGLKQLNGDANPDRTPSLVRWRREAVMEMAAEARRLGADAVIAMKFDNRQITPVWTEICAYGTAVRLARQPVEESSDKTRPQTFRGVAASRTKTDIPLIKVDPTERPAPVNQS